MDNFVYKNDTLQFFSTEEGRARYDTTQHTAEATAFNFDYFLKDHLGDVRVVLTEQKDTAQYPALSFEGASGSTEQQNQDKIWENKSGASINIASVRTSRPGAFGTSGSNGSYVELVRRSTGAIGGAKLLKVMAGDRIHTSVDYYYTAVNANNTTANGIGSLIANFATAIAASGQVGGALKDAASGITSGLSGNTALSTLLNTPNSTSGSNAAPKAYLNIIFFDDQFHFDNTASVVVPVAYSPNTKGTLSRMMASAVTAPKSGFVYVYFSNETEELVYFDNFVLTQEKGPMLEETHYYPFGLTMAGISSHALGKLDNKRGFNGNEIQNKEFSDGSGLELYDFNARTYDQQIGRFIQIDPLVEDGQESLTPYHFSNNNPIRYNDPSGKCPTCLPAIVEVLVAVAEAAFGATTEVAAGTTVVAVVAKTSGPLLMSSFGSSSLGDIAGNNAKATAADKTASLGKEIKSLEKSQKSLGENVKEHQQKLEDYKKDPDKYDNKGELKNVTPELRKQKIDGRINALEKQVKKNQENLDKTSKQLDQKKQELEKVKQGQ